MGYYLPLTRENKLKFTICLKGQSHKKVGEIRPWDVSLRDWNLGPGRQLIGIRHGPLPHCSECEH
jgi:hypothetical protein